MYQVQFKRFFTLHHLAKDDNGKCLCGKDWITGLDNEIFLIPEASKIEDACACKTCLKVFKKQLNPLKKQ